MLDVEIIDELSLTLLILIELITGIVFPVINNSFTVQSITLYF